jgi:ariadne-1
MTCRQCKHEFCWICMGNWADHGQQSGGYYKCNKFDAAELPATVTEAQRAKAELDRYLHYYQRYQAHESGLKFADKLRESSEKRMMEQQELQRSTWMDVQFLKQAAEQVRECRRVLKFTYVLGYYLKDKTPEKSLFEYHQEMLEKHTERLQEFTERPLDQLQRSDVVNLTRVTERFMESLLQSMSGGIVRVEEASRLYHAAQSV